MDKGIILYQSKYGATKKYVDWLVEATGFDFKETPKASLDTVSQYDTIILCGGIYASGIAGLSFLKKNVRKLPGKKIAVLCVGASPYDEDALNQLKASRFTGDLKDIPLFYARGMWDEGGLTVTDHTLCKLLNKSLAKRDPETYEPWMQAFVNSVGQYADWTDKEYLLPVQSYLGISLA